MTLKEYRVNLGWSLTRLAREAGITRQTVSSAEVGRSIIPTTAKAIADALSKAYEQQIRPTDIEGLHII